MYNKLICLICVVVVLGLLGSANAAGIAYTDANELNHLWSDPCNWDANSPLAPGPPNSIDCTAQFNNDDTICQITDGMTALCKAFMLGMYGSENEAEISGGTLTCDRWMNVGRANEYGGKGYLLVTGGDIDVGGRLGIPNQFVSCIDEDKIGVGHVDLFGGTLACGNLLIGNGKVGQLNGPFGPGDLPEWGGIGSIEMTGGTLIVGSIEDPGNVVDWSETILKYIKKGWITAYNGSGDLLLDFDVRTAFKCTLTAYLDPNKAQEPSPAHMASDLPTDDDVVLSWLPGAYVQGAAGHDVFFGTDFDDVNDATKTVHPGVEYYNRDVNSCGPFSLDLSKGYCWRVDQLNDAHPNSPWKGHVWQFMSEDYLVVDDFESYDGGNPLSGTWTASGSAVAALETSVVHDGNAMSVGYSDTAAVVARGIAGEDWTQRGIRALYIWCNADPNADELGVKLNNAGVEQTVSNVGQTPGWQELKFDLSEFDVDLSNVSNIAVKITAVTTGAGTVYIDDIRLYPCKPGVLAADFNGDCAVDFKDFAVFADTWFEEELWP